MGDDDTAIIVIFLIFFVVYRYLLYLNSKYNYRMYLARKKRKETKQIPKI